MDRPVLATLAPKRLHRRPHSNPASWGETSDGGKSNQSRNPAGFLPALNLRMLFRAAPMSVLFASSGDRPMPIRSLAHRASGLRPLTVDKNCLVHNAARLAAGVAEALHDP